MSESKSSNHVINQIHFDKSIIMFYILEKSGQILQEIAYIHAGVHSVALKLLQNYICKQFYSSNTRVSQ